MRDFYSNIADTLKDCLPSPTAERIRCTGRGLEILCKDPAVFENWQHPLFETPRQKGNMYYLWPSEVFFRESMAHILQEAFPLKALTDVKESWDYAYMRLYMRSRKIRKGESLDEAHKEALWLLMGTVEEAVDARVRRFRLLKSTEAVLKLGLALPPRERQFYYENTGLAAECMAMLLCRGRSMLKE